MSQFTFAAGNQPRRNVNWKEECQLKGGMSTESRCLDVNHHLYIILHKSSHKISTRAELSWSRVLAARTVSQDYINHESLANVNVSYRLSCQDQRTSQSNVAGYCSASSLYLCPIWIFKRHTCRPNTAPVLWGNESKKWSGMFSLWTYTVQVHHISQYGQHRCTWPAPAHMENEFQFDKATKHERIICLG